MNLATSYELNRNYSKALKFYKEAEQEFQEKLNVLTIEELSMLQKIGQKIERQDKRIKIVPESLRRFDTLEHSSEKDRETYTTKQDNSLEQLINGKNSESDLDEYSELRIQPIQPQQIPATKWNQNPLNPKREYRRTR